MSWKTEGPDGRSLAAALEHRPSSNIRREHVSAEYLRVRNRHDVAVENDKIGVASRRSASPSVCSWNAAYAGQMVIDLSASSRVIFCSGNQPPGGQLLSSCRDTAAWNENSGFTRSTGKSLPFGMMTPVFEQRPPRVRAERSRVAQASWRPVHVARLMHGLHRGNDAELREARDVGVIEDLNVLDAEPMVDRRDGFERGLVRVERDAVAAVADGVRRRPGSRAAARASRRRADARAST